MDDDAFSRLAAELNPGVTWYADSLGAPRLLGRLRNASFLSCAIEGRASA